jgi:hypothetical protein
MASYGFTVSQEMKGGDVAQSVEQRTENPCVGGSIPSITTNHTSLPEFFRKAFLFQPVGKTNRVSASSTEKKHDFF